LGVRQAENIFWRHPAAEFFFEAFEDGSRRFHRKLLGENGFRERDKIPALRAQRARTVTGKNGRENGISLRKMPLSLGEIEMHFEE
jgi:hypothetical protein